MFFHVFRCSKLTRESVWVVQKSQMQLSLAYTFMIMLSALYHCVFDQFQKLAKKGKHFWHFTIWKSDRGHQVSRCLFSGVFSHRSHKKHTLSSPKVSIFVFKNTKNVLIPRSTIPTLTPPKNVYEGSSHKKLIISRRGQGGNCPFIAGNKGKYNWIRLRHLWRVWVRSKKGSKWDPRAGYFSS